MSGGPTALRIAFVSAPGGSAFMEELLSAVAAAVSATGVESFCHSGYISDVAAPNTRFVVIPHEYFAYASSEPMTLYAATIGFGVEHPGTEEFASAWRESQRLGAQFQISRDAVAETVKRGGTAHNFTLGYVGQWDRWHGQEAERPVDLVYLGTADERRVGLLSTYAEDLQDLNCELLLPPHEPMTVARPDFLLSDAKWRLLARSKVLINLHREGKTAFEWVRCLEAITNGCVVVTEPSSDLGPLKPGEHLVVAEPARLAAVARAMIRLPSLRQAIAHRAYDLCRTELDMAESARLLTEVAATLPAPSGDAINGLRRPSQITSVGEKEPAMAIWVPGTQDLPQAGPSASPWIIRQLEELSELRASRAIVSAARMNGPPADVDVICVHRPGDGPLGLTVESISGAHGAIGLRLAMSPSAAAEESTVPWGARTFLTADLEIGRARQRNVLVETSDSELLCFLDAGDAVLGDTLHKLVTLMKDNQDLDIAFPMATCGPNRMTNVLIPEKRRLLTRAYLTRGFLVRRRWLEDIGGFSEDPYLEDLVDHAFWLRSASAGASVHLLRQIGFKLWPRKQEPGLATLDPARTRAAISSITEASRETTAASRPVALHE